VRLFCYAHSQITGQRTCLLVNLSRVCNTKISYLDSRVFGVYRHHFSRKSDFLGNTAFSNSFWQAVVLAAAGVLWTASGADASTSLFWSDSDAVVSRPPQARPQPRHKAARHPKNSKEEVIAKDSAKPQGPLIIAVSIDKQTLKIYDDNGLFAETPVSTGMRGHSTPMGVFSVIQKHKFHHSNIYSGAPMPYMQRITWSGVAMHAGVLPGYPASHGCIRMPMNFAVKMWGWTKMGGRVVVTPGELSPENFSHAFLTALQTTPVAAASTSETKSDRSEVTPTITREQARTADASGAMPARPSVTMSDATVGDAAAKPGQVASVEAKPAEPKSADLKSADLKSADLKSAETPSSEAKPAEIKSSEAAPVEAKPADTKPAEAGSIDAATEQPKAAETEVSEKPEIRSTLSEPPTPVAETAKTATSAPDAAKAETAAPETAKNETAKTEADKTEPAKTADKIDAGKITAPTVVEKATGDAGAADVKKDQARPSEKTASKPDPATAPKRTGQIAVFISRKDNKLYVRQNFAPLFETPVNIAADPRPLGTHVFTAEADKGDVKSFHWTVVTLPMSRQAERRDDDERASRRRKTIGAVETKPLPVPDTPAEALNRITIPEDARARIFEALSTGGSIIVSDQGIAAGETGEGTDFIVSLR
jgi:lipoprotein-anchoring transpeptidase ErfK/SrfK